MNKRDKFAVLEWASDFQTKNIDKMTPEESKEALNEAAYYLGPSSWAQLIGGVRMEESEEIPQMKERLKIIQSKTTALFEALRMCYQQEEYEENSYTISIEWDRKHVVQFSDIDTEPYSVDGFSKDGIDVTFWKISKKGTTYEYSPTKGIIEHENAPYRLEVVEADSTAERILLALDIITLNMFKTCKECGRVFFHWRKRERKYCSKRCQNTAAVKRHRLKQGDESA